MVPAAKVSLSSLVQVGTYWQAAGNTRKLRTSLRPPTLTQLSSIYLGLQAHQLLFYLNLYLRMEQATSQATSRSPSCYCLWQKQPARDVWDHVLKTTIAWVNIRRGVERAIARARVSLNLWLQFQNFYVNLPPASQRTFHESRLHKPGKREAHWNAKALDRQREAILSNVETLWVGPNRHHNCFVADDLLMATPAHLYIRVTDQAALLCWVQPDLVTVKQGHITIYDHKFERELPDKSGLDNFGRLQILLLTLAGSVLAARYLCKRRRSSSLPEIPLFQLTLEEIPLWLNQVRVIYQQPNILQSDGRFKQVEMTLNDNEIAGALFDLQQVILYLAMPTTRNGVYDYLAACKRVQEGVTPETMFLPEPTPFQPLLGI